MLTWPYTDKFRCCRSLDKVDRAGDLLQEWIRGNFNAPYSRDSRCLIYDDKTCGQCGTKCDECGNSCENVCPGGKCSFQEGPVVETRRWRTGNRHRSDAF